MAAAQIDLERLTTAGAAVLRDRSIPGTRGSVGYVVVASSGVWLVATKHYTGGVEYRDHGGWFHTDLHLYVDHRDRTKLIDAMARQATIVREMLDGSVPVHGVLCFTDAGWPRFAKPFEIDCVLVVWPKRLVELLARARSRRSSIGGRGTSFGSAPSRGRDVRRRELGLTRTSSGSATAELADEASPLPCGVPTPHADLLAAEDGLLQAGLADLAHRADRLRLETGILVVLGVEDLGVRTLATADFPPARDRRR